MRPVRRPGFAQNRPGPRHSGPAPGPAGRSICGSHKAGVAQNEIGQDIITVKDRHGCPADLSVCRDGHDGGVIPRQGGMIEDKVAHFDLVVAVPFVALNDHQIAGPQPGKHIFKGKAVLRRGVRG